MAQESPLRGIDARTKILLTLMITMAIMLPLARLLLLGAAVAILLAVGRLLGPALQRVRKMVIFLCALFLFDWIFIGLQFAVTITLRFVLLTVISVLLFGSTTPEEFRQGLCRLGFPYRYAFALGIAFQSIPMLADELRHIREAQMARGAFRNLTGWRNLPARLRESTAIIVPAIVLTTRRAWSLTESVHARGFGSPHRRLPASPLTWHDYALLAGTLGIILPLHLL